MVNMKELKTEPDVMKCSSIHESASEWLSNMETQKLKPTTITYTTVMNACAQVGDLQKTVFWVKKMKAASLKADTTACATVINACAKHVNVDEAQKWHQRMVRAKTHSDVIFKYLEGVCKGWPSRRCGYMVC